MPDEVQTFINDAVGVLKARLGTLFDSTKKDAGPWLAEIGVKLGTQSLRLVRAADEQERQMAQLQINLLIVGAEAEARIQQLAFVRAAEATGRDLLEMGLAVAGDLLKKGLSILLKIPIP